MTSQQRPAGRMLLYALWALIVGSAIPVGEGSSAGPHLLVLSLLAMWALVSGSGPGSATWALLGLFAILLAHFLAASSLSPCLDMFAKSAASQLMLMWLLFACATLAHSVRLGSVSAMLRAIVGFITASVLLEKAYLMASGASALIRPSGIYSEPSHLALAVAPLLVALMMHRPDRLYGWTCASLLFLLSGSGTLFLVVLACLGAAQLALSARLFSLLPRIVLGLAMVGSLIWVSPFRDDFIARVQGVLTLDTQSNLSSVVYVAGWQMADENLRTTNWLGLGINRMGCVPRPITAAGEILELFDLGDGNYNDGSFTMSKALSEFGALAILLWLLLARQTMRAIRRSRRCLAVGHQQLRVLLISTMAVLIFGSLVRGTGYFAGTFQFGILAAFMLERDDVWT